MTSAIAPGCRDDDQDPQISVGMFTAGEAAEVLALISELIRAEPAVTAAITRFLDRKGADPVPATAWLTAAAGELAARLDAALAFEGVSVDRALARYWRRPAVTR
jgi:hypothetical protein